MTSGDLQGKLAVALKVRQHDFISGVPPKLGGQDEGPDPHELIEAALVGCTILTLKMYLDRKGWAVENIHVEVKILSEGQGRAVLKRDIKVDGNLTEEQRQQILFIADKCPIHKLLVGNVEIQSELL